MTKIRDEREKREETEGFREEGNEREGEEKVDEKGI